MTLKVVSSKNLPARPPLLTTAVAWLLLDRLHAPGWAWGAAAVVLAFLEEPTDPFEKH